MYTVRDYGHMIKDDVRTHAYVEALRAAVGPGSVVVDIGAGTGVFALVACKLGARRVFAIERGEIIEVARRMAIDNGLADRVEFMHEDSTRVLLPEPADVVVSDLPAHNYLDVILDARRRFLKPEGRMIPAAERVWATIVEAPKEYQSLVEPWATNSLGIDMRAALGLVTQNVIAIGVTPEQMLAEARQIAVLDYMNLAAPRFAAASSWVAAKRGTVHGAIVWYEIELLEGIGLSSRPGAENPSYLNRHLFFPLTRPVDVNAGDSVELELRAERIRGSWAWTWRTVFAASPSRPCVQFTQSTAFGAPISVDQLRKLDMAHVPRLNEEGQVDAQILHLMREGIRLEEIARRLSVDQPGRFSDWTEAMNRVGQLSSRYSE